MADERIDIVIADQVKSSIARKILAIGEAAAASHKQVLLLRQALNFNNLNLGIRNSGVTKIRRDVTQATAATNVFTRSLTRLGATVSSVGTRVARTGRNLLTFRARMVAASRATRHGISALRSYLSLGALVGAGGVLKATDNYRTLQNQLRGVSESQAQLNTLTSELFQVANRARVPVTSLTKSFRRFDIALRDMGAGQRESLRLTETVGKALVLSGSNAGEATSALLQLSQAFNKGRLNGDEFRSVAELMPSVIGKIAEVMGKTRGELFDASKDGEITAQIMREAFAKLADDVDAQMGRIPRTIGQAWTQLLNTITQAFGEWDRRTGFLDRVIRAIDWIGNNLPKVIQYLRAFAAGLALIVAPFIISGLIYIAGFFATPLGWITAAGVYFAFFADQIKIGGEAMVTLRDAFTGFFQTVGPIVQRAISKMIGFAGSIATPQQVFDFTLSVLNKLIDGVIYLVATVRALYRTWSTLDWATVWTIAKDAVLHFLYIVQLVTLQTFITILEGIESMVQPIANFFGQGEAFANSMRTAYKSVGDEIVRVGEQLNTWGPEATAAYNAFNNTFQGLRDSARATVDLFGSQIVEAAHANMLSRIGINWNRSWQEWVNVAIQAVNQVIAALNSLSGLAIGKISVIGSAALRPQTEGIREYTGALNDAAAAQTNLAANGNQSFNQLGNSVNNFGQQSQSAIGSVFGNIQNALTQFVRTGKLDFKELMRSILADLLKLFTNKLFQQLLGGIGGGGGGGGFGGGGGLFGGGGGFFGGGGFLGALFGFAKGGYTGSGGVGQIAGVVHGQEFVMPAAATRRNRPALEAMRNGSSASSSYGSSKGMTVKINNYANATVETRQNSDGELEITMRKIAEETVANKTPKLIASNLRRANSRESKALTQSTHNKRKR